MSTGARLPRPAAPRVALTSWRVARRGDRGTPTPAPVDGPAGRRGAAVVRGTASGRTPDGRAAAPGRGTARRRRHARTTRRRCGAAGRARGVRPGAARCAGTGGRCRGRGAGGRRVGLAGPAARGAGRTVGQRGRPSRLDGGDRPVLLRRAGGGGRGQGPQARAGAAAGRARDSPTPWRRPAAPLPGVDVALLNPARKVSDGELIVVGVTPPPGPGGAGDPAAGGAPAAGRARSTSTPPRWPSSTRCPASGRCSPSGSSPTGTSTAGSGCRRPAPGRRHRRRPVRAAQGPGDGVSAQPRSVTHRRRTCGWPGWPWPPGSPRSPGCTSAPVRSCWRPGGAVCAGAGTLHLLGPSVAPAAVARRYGWIAVAVRLGVVCGAAATAARLVVRDAPPIRALAEARAPVTADLVVRDDPAPVRCCRAARHAAGVDRADPTHRS